MLSLSQDLFHFSAGIDQLVVTDKAAIAQKYPFPGRMAVTVSFCFMISGLSLLGFSAKKPFIQLLSQYLLHLVTVIAAMAIIGYLYGASLFYNLSNVGAMAISTAVLLFLVSIGASLLHPSLGITQLFTGDLVGNKMARRLFVLTVLAVIILGILRVQTQYFYQFTLNLWVSLVTVCFLSLSLLMIWNTATWLNRMDLKRAQAEQEIKVMNEELEQIVEQRTDAFQKSEGKYRLLIEHASDAIYVVDIKGNFTDVNDSMCKMIGYSREELLQSNVEDIIDPEELKTDPVKHGQRVEGESVTRERRFMSKDKLVFDVEISVKGFADDKVLIMARDVTNRKKMEAELREAEIKFRTLADKSMVGVYISQKERFRYVNPRFAEIFGYRPQELINAPGSAIEKIISDDYIQVVRGNVEARYKGEVDNVHYEVQGKKKDGTTNWVEFYGSRVILGGEPTIIGSMLDITERKFADELILREKALSDSIINSLPGIFYLHNDHGKFLRWNENFETVTGYTSQEIEALNAMDMIAQQDRGTVRKAVEKVFKEGYALVEAKAVTKEGTTIPHLFTGTSIIYENQQCLLGTGIDISSRIKAEEELRLSEQKYKLLFDSNPVPLWMIAKDDLSIIAVNDAAANLYGYSKDELLHSRITIVRLKEELDEQQERFRTEILGATDLGVTRHVKKDGALMYVQIIASDIVFDGREVRLSLTNDITEKIEAEELLKKSEANLQTILGTTDTAYALFDLDFKLLAFNQKAVQFTIEQYDHVPEKGDRIADYFPSDRFPQFMNFAAEVLKGKHISYEVAYPQSGGTEFWYDVRLFPITNANKDILGLMMALYDITERKNTERDLKDAYERIQIHINSIKDMVWKQSHLIRSPLANLKALADMLKESPTDTEVLDHFHAELNRMDEIIIEMAEDASDHGITD